MTENFPEQSEQKDPNNNYACELSLKVLARMDMVGKEEEKGERRSRHHDDTTGQPQQHEPEPALCQAAHLLHNVTELW